MTAKCNRYMCIHCGGCVGACPANAICLAESRIQVDKEKCIDCGSCVKFCPVGALGLKK